MAASWFLSLAGTRFRATRIAGSARWRDVFLANREEVLKQSQRFRHTLDALEHVMRTGNPDALEAMIRQSAEQRASWQMPAPPKIVGPGLTRARGASPGPRCGLPMAPVHGRPRAMADRRPMLAPQPLGCLDFPCPSC